jgi:hypothetical protein
MAEAVFLVCAGVLLTIVAFVVAYAGIQSVGWSLEHPSQLIVAILGIGALFGGVLAAGLALRWLRLRGISLLVGCGALPILMLGALVVGWWAIPMLFVAAAIDSARRSLRGGAPARPDVGIAPDEPRP